MISLCRIFFAFVLATCLGTASFAHDPARVVMELDYSGDGTNEDIGHAADNAFSLLDAHDGRIIYIDLTLRPHADPDRQGYSFERMGPPVADSSNSSFCGGDGGENAGMLDNLSTLYTVSAGHPNNFHAPLEVVVGDRLTFPHQEITCSAESNTSGQPSPLYVRGYFSIQTGSIPTAITYRLTPANP